MQMNTSPMHGLAPTQVHTTDLKHMEFLAGREGGCCFHLLALPSVAQEVWSCGRGSSIYCTASPASPLQCWELYLEKRKGLEGKDSWKIWRCSQEERKFTIPIIPKKI